MKYAFFASISQGYLFGLNSTMNAMNYFGCHADWEITYVSVPEEYRNKMSNAFPFKVHWTPLTPLLDKYKALYGNGKPDQFWAAWSALAIEKMDNYDAICVIQGDEFVFSNMTPYFSSAAKADITSISEHYNNYKTIEELPFGREQEVYNRAHCTFTDQLICTNSKFKVLFEYLLKSQLRPPEKGESNHPVIALNRAVCKYLNPNDVIPLDRNEWCFQKGIMSLPLRKNGKKMYNDRSWRIKGIHNRWWMDGRVATELHINKNKDMSNFKNNVKVIRSLMSEFNDMTPETKINLEWKL